MKILGERTARFGSLAARLGLSAARFVRSAALLCRPETRFARSATRSAGRLAAPALAAMLLLVFPDFLYACPVCFDRDDEARLAFLATTGLLTLLPLGMVAGVGAWLRKRAREAEQTDDLAGGCG